jgi:hypothetical protein
MFLMVQSINQNRVGGSPTTSQPKPQVIVQKSNTAWLTAAILGVLLILGLLAAAMYWKSSQAGSLSGVNSNQYQALFLTNGQVYFGKLSQSDSKTVNLKDIYYLQVQQTVQPKPNESPEETAKNQKISLAKLGGELHGPEDSMYVDRGQVLFWENLKNDGKVVKAIKDYKNKQ